MSDETNNSEPTDHEYMLRSRVDSINQTTARVVTTTRWETTSSDDLDYTDDIESHLDRLETYIVGARKSIDGIRGMGDE